MVAQVNRSIMHPVQIVQGVSNAPYAYRSLVQWFDCINFVRAIDKTTPRLIQFHTLKNAVNPPFLGGFSIFNTVVA
ncbi:hypothetical protein HMPREF0982_00453 [Erysipelotrichaceae bacterium 21_3]|nr:hypothetical protein HMPREF0982_00453 [Erysipelotrichaceae bacterium 21_3]